MEDGFFTVHSSAQSHTFRLPTSNCYGPENLDLIGEVGMSNDSSFQDETQDFVPSRPQQGSDEPTLDPDDPDKYDPLKSPSGDRPEDWKDHGERTTPEADEQSPLSDDRR
ncbi:hypothetical protein [Pseudomonas sp. C2B4]|uniref:hypothetical protein n=1 Tax=Pseudomonas sp. C2B4 TaxID=2735270 RepID=UPI002113A30F|nr:hypothetical protein [Pseudomonas sp. C2B4]